MILARVVVGLTLAIGTTASVLLIGLNTTSALIQLLMFAFALAVWVAVGRAKSAAGGLRIRGITTKGRVRIKQAGADASVQNVDAASDVDILQRSQDR